MMDILYLALGLGFFLASWWFVNACSALASVEEDKK